jgi:hypothetical protein
MPEVQPHLVLLDRVSLAYNALSRDTESMSILRIANEGRHGAPATFDLERERSRAVACTGLVLRFHAVKPRPESLLRYRGILGIRGKEPTSLRVSFRVFRVFRGRNPVPSFLLARAPGVGCGSYNDKSDR